MSCKKITYFKVGNTKNLWWCKKMKKWIKFDDKPEGADLEDKRSFHSRRKAFKHMCKMGKRFYVIRLSRQRNNSKGWRIEKFEYTGTYSYFDSNAVNFLKDI